MSGHMGEIPHTSLPSVWWNFHREVSLTLFAFLSSFSLQVLDLLPQICYNNTWIILSKTTEQTRNQTVVNRTKLLGKTPLNLSILIFSLFPFPGLPSLDSIGKEQTKTATELAYAEVIGYNKKNLERELQNESQQQNRKQNKTKRREEEI